MSKNIKELPAEKLRYTCDPNQFTFETTAELPQLEEVVGQERAVKAIDFGVNIKNYGFNIYVLGPGGAGRTSIIKEAIERRAKSLPVPNDWCYVYNFNDPDKPNAIQLPAGKAKVLQAKMDNLIQELQKEIPLALNSEDFQKEQNQIVQRFHEKQNKLLHQLDKKAKGKGFTLQKGPTGFLLVPYKDGKVVSITGASEEANVIERYFERDENNRNIAEFAIGTNPNARLIGIMAEDKKVAGTVHFAIGDSMSLGGVVQAEIHLDGLMLKPTVIVDNKQVLVENGKLMV